MGRRTREGELDFWLAQEYDRAQLKRHHILPKEVDGKIFHLASGAWVVVRNNFIKTAENITLIPNWMHALAHHYWSITVTDSVVARMQAVARDGLVAILDERGKNEYGEAIKSCNRQNLLPLDPLFERNEVCEAVTVVRWENRIHRRVKPRTDIPWL